MALIKCTECGKEVSDKATTCPNCGAPISTSTANQQPKVEVKVTQKKKKGSCLKTILIVFGVLIVLAVIGNLAGGEDKKETPAQSEASTNVPSDTEEVDNSKSGIGEENVPEEVNASEEVDNIFNVGDVADTGSVTITYLSAEEYISDNEFMQPKDGNMYYRIGFEIENTGDSDAYVSSWDWDCYADGYAAEQTYFDDESLDATLSSGKKTKGYIFFEVPADAEEITLEYETSFWTQNKIIFIVK